MKKVLSLVLVLAMVLGTFSFAFAAPANDVEGTQYEDAVARLMALEVLNGYPDGTFRPNNTITRGEFAAAVVKTVGLETAANAAKGTTSFTDVPAAHWASGYINIASKMGYVNGMGDGSFAPDSPVTYEQAVTLVMRVLGYEPAAKVRGGYPFGYLTLAEENDLTDDVNGIVGLAASRGVVAQLLNNGLEVPMMIQKGYGDLATFVVSGTDGTDEQTILDSKLGLKKVEAKVNSVDTDDLEIVVYEKDDKGNYSEKEEYDVLDSISIVGLENAVVTLWVKGGEVLSLDVDSAIKYDFISKVNGATDAVDVNNGEDNIIEDVKLLNEGETYDVAMNDDDESILEVYVNGSKLEDDDSFNPSKNYFAKVILNGDEVVTLEAYEVKEAGLISEVEDDMLTYTRSDSTRKVRDLDDADELIVVINGEAATYEDLDEGMYFDYNEYASDEYIIVATDANVEGEFDRIDRDDEEVRIDGEYYALAGSYYMSSNEGESYSSADLDDLDDLFDEEVVALLNNQGDVIYLSAAIEDTTSSFYGFYDLYNPYAETLRVKKVVDGDVDKATYDVDLSSKSECTIESNGDVKKGDAVVLDNDNSSDDLERLFKFTVNEDDEITKISKVNLDEYTISSFNDDYDYIKDDTNGKVYVEDAVIFDLTDTDGYDALGVFEWKDIEGTSGNSLNITAFADDQLANVLVFTTGGDILGEEDLDDYVGFVTAREKVASDKYEIKVDTAEGTETYVFDTDDSDVTPGKYQVAIYELVSDDEVNVVASAVYDDLASLEDNDGVYKALSGTIDKDSIDGKYFEANNKLYKLASDALVYEVVDPSDDDYEIADLNDIDDEGDTRDTVYFLTQDGVVKVLFFEKAE